MIIINVRFRISRGCFATFDALLIGSTRGLVVRAVRFIRRSLRVMRTLYREDYFG